MGINRNEVHNFQASRGENVIKEIVQTECLPASLTYQYVIIFLYWKVFKELRPKTVILVMLPLTLSVVPAIE